MSNWRNSSHFLTRWWCLRSEYLVTRVAASSTSGIFDWFLEVFLKIIKWYGKENWLRNAGTHLHVRLLTQKTQASRYRHGKKPQRDGDWVFARVYDISRVISVVGKLLYSWLPKPIDNPVIAIEIWDIKRHSRAICNIGLQKIYIFSSQVKCAEGEACLLYR